MKLLVALLLGLASGVCAAQGVEPQALTPQAFDALLREDFQKMARVVKASGARID